MPTITIPWCNSGSIMETRVVSWPPCMVAVEVNTAAGLPASRPFNHSSPVLSQKYFIGAAILPKRVGEPSATPMHSTRSFSSAYGAPVSVSDDGAAGAFAGSTVVTRGTVRTRAVQPVTLPTPRATSCAISLTAPVWL